MTTKKWIKALSPLIATLFLIGIATVIGGIYYAWVTEFVQTQSNAIIGQTEENINCSYAGLLIRSCDYNGTRLLIRIQNSGTLNFNQSLSIQVLDGNNNVGISYINQDLNAGQQLDVNSDDFPNRTDFTGLQEPLRSIRVIPGECSQRYTEVTNCN